MKYTKLLLAVLSASAVSGCVQQRAAFDIEDNISKTNSIMKQAAAPLQSANRNAINSHSNQFVGTRSVLNEHGDPLPQRVERRNGITISNGSQSIGLKEVASIITSSTKIPVIIAADVVISESSAASPAAVASAPAPLLASGPVPEGFDLAALTQQLDASSSTPSVISASSSLPPSGEMVLNYSGKMSGLLDMVAANFNVNWKYERGQIVFETSITRNFDVPALPMSTSLAFSVGSQATGSSGQSASTAVTVDVFGEMTDALTKLVGSDAFSINRSTGIVTVTGSPASVNRARTYITNLNTRLADQVALSVKVYSVRVSDDEDFSLNLGGVFNDGANSLNLLTSGTAGAVTGGGSLGWALIDQGSQFSNSNAAVGALSERGDVSVVTTASLTTMNGQPVPLQVGQDRDYVKEITVTAATTNSAASTSFETAEVSTGFALQLMPRIQRNGDVLLQYGVNITELVGANDGFDERTIGTSTIQLKRLNQRNFIQNASIPHGKTLVVAGFEQVRNSTQNSGVGNPLFKLFGGGSSASKEREVIVIMITPTVLK